MENIYRGMHGCDLVWPQNMFSRLSCMAEIFFLLYKTVLILMPVAKTIFLVGPSVCNQATVTDKVQGRVVWGCALVIWREAPSKYLPCNKDGGSWHIQSE